MSDVVHIGDQSDREPDWLAEQRGEAFAHLAGRPNGSEPIQAAQTPDDEPRTPLDRITAAAVGTADLKAMPPADPLIAGLLDLDSLALIYGPSGGSKSFLTIDLALHVATGSWWNGKEVHGGPVVYVAAEGARGIGRRIESWQKHHGTYDLERHHPIWWLPMPVNLHNAAWAGAFAEFCASREPVFVAIDTLARCTAGADENSAKDMGVVIDNLDRVKRRTGACTAGVHHSGKDLGSGARGSSALRAAVDTELEVSSTDDGRVTVKVTKQKDGPEPLPWRLVRTPLADSCVLLPDHGQTATTELSRSYERALEGLRAVAIPGGVPSSTWEAAVTSPESSDRIGRSTYFEARSALLQAGLVQNVGTEARALYAPVTPGQDTNQP